MRILGLVDGSAYAESVCDHIAWVSGRIEVTVVVLHVIGRRDNPMDPVNLSGSIGLGARAALLEELAAFDAQRARVAQKRGRLLLDEAQARLRAAGIPSVDARLRNGDLIETALEAEAETDLIVIGKRGEGADFARGHLGSNLERVVRSTHKTILIASRAYRPISKFLIAFDGGPIAFRVVDQVARSPVLAGLGCKLVMAGEDTAENHRKLQDAVAILQAAGHGVDAALVQGRADQVIAATIEREGFDLLAMGAFSHSRLRSLFIGSTTAEMIRSCKIPVVIVR